MAAVGSSPILLQAEGLPQELPIAAHLHPCSPPAARERPPSCSGASAVAFGEWSAILVLEREHARSERLRDDAQRIDIYFVYIMLQAMCCNCLRAVEP
jgi:hypothetical protein